MSSSGTCAKCGAPLPRGALGNRCPRCLLASALTDEDDQEPPVAQDQSALPSAPAPSVRRFGDYELLEEIARGGMGVVYKARQVSLNRVVAVKMILSGHFASPNSVQRFHAEAEAAANLHHPNIVAIHEFGEYEGQPFFSMDYVEGRSLADLTRDKPLPARAAARYVQTLAQAIEYAHQHGILHRDLKPSNIVIDAEDQPRITDFGLAKRLTSDSQRSTPDPQRTLTGQALGSPNYMPPEQAAGCRADIGPHSDVYSLGAILYHLLTGRAPFLAETVPATLRQVQEAEPIAVRLLNPSVPRDLETICLKCLEKDHRRRFATAQGLADELGRFLNGEPIHTQPLNAAEKTWRWCRRNPKLAVLASAVVLLALVIVLGTPLALFHINKERTQALRHAAEESHQHQLAAAALYRLEIQRAQDLFANDNASGALAILAFLLRESPSDRAVAEWIMNELTYRSFALPALEPLRHDDMVFFAQFSADGRRLLTVSRNNRAQLSDAAAGTAVTPPFQHDASLEKSGEFLGPLKPLFARFSPGGARVVTASADRRARVWDTSTGQPLTPWLEHSNWVTFAQFSPDEKVLATACNDGSVQLWELPSGRRVSDSFKHSKPISSVEFSPDGAWVLTASEDATAQVWERRTGARVGPAMQHERWVRYAAFSPDAQRVVTISSDYTARLWVSRTGAAASPLMRHEGVVNSARFSPDGAWVVTTSFDKTARVWDVASGQLAYPPLKHKGTVRSAVFSPEGYRIVTASEDGTARMWDTLTGEPLTQPFRHNAAVWFAAFSPDGQRVVTASADKTVQVWDVRPGQAMRYSPAIGGIIRSVQWGGNSQLLFRYLNAAMVYDAANGRLERGRWFPHKEEVLSAQLSSDGQRVVTAGIDRIALLWDAHTARLVAPPLQHEGAVHYAQFSPDGRRVVTASADHTARVWDAQTGQALFQPLHHDDVVYHAEFSPNGRWVVTAGADKQARVWDSRTGQLACPPFVHRDEVVSATFSPDSQSVATASKDQTARVWDVRLGRPLTQPLEHDGPVHSVRFNPDGQLLVTASQDHTARVWEARTGRPVTEPLTHEGAVNMADFTRDGDRVVTASDDGTARIWDARTGQPCVGPLQHRKGVLFAQLSPDAHWLASGCADHRVYLHEFIPAHLPISDWLPDLAEAVAGQKLNPQGSLKSVPTSEVLRLKRRLEQSAGTNGCTRWAQWFLADRLSRPISPSSKTFLGWKVHESIEDAYVNEREALTDLVKALHAAPTNGLLYAQLARAVAEHGSTSPTQLLAQVDWLSRRAITLLPEHPVAWWSRAVYFEKAGNLEAALQAMDQGSLRGSDNTYFWLAWGRLFEKAGRIQEADEAFTKAFEVVEHSPVWDSAGRNGIALERAKFLERQGRSAEAKVEFLRAKGVPRRESQVPSSLIDLTAFYNITLGEAWLSASPDGNDLAPVPQGRQTLAGVEFDVRGLIQVSSAPWRANRLDYPETVADILIRQRCRRLHFLHATHEPVADGTQIGSYVVHYAGGQQHEVPIIYGKDVRGWNLDPPIANSPAAAAWRGQNGVGLTVQLFKSTWENPQPDMEIETLDFVSKMTQSAPFLVAITAEP